MANYNPYQARQARKRKRQGTLTDVLQMLWAALTTAEEVLAESVGDAEQRMRAVHCLSQAAGQYARLLEVGELEARVQAMETTLAALAGRNGHTRIGAQ